jgi:(R,R)-butanediol dehydrogenase/meso-butanediol dehydrogenase/diacetyl reductase
VKVAVYEGPRLPFRIEERPTPAPGADELLIKIGRCGICATDVSTYTGDAGMETGLVYGHEFAGEVVGLGTDVRDFEIGQRVTAQCVTACGRCAECRQGHLVFCTEWRPHPSGGFGQFMTLPAREAYRLPLLGAGAIGLSAAFWARRHAARKVVVAATSERRKRMALEMGASAFITIGSDAERALENSLGGPPDVVLECAGFPGAMMQAMTFAAPKGIIVGLGYGLHPEEIITAVPLFKELRVQFSMTYTREDYEEVIATLAAGHLEPRCMITDTIPLEALTTTIQALLDGAPQCKVMVDPWA